MPKLPQLRHGTQLEIKGRLVPYSFWPMRRGSRRYGLQSHLFTPNPWAVIADSVKKTAPVATKAAALAFVEQAEEYYRAATQSGLVAAKPVLLYYCFMNLSKAYISCVSPTVNISQPKHGLSERLAAGGRELVDAYLDAYRSSGASVNLFDALLEAITGRSLTANARYDMPKLMPQIVTGHRLWCQSTSAQERFIAIESIEFIHEKASQSVWLRFYIPSGDLTRLGLTHQRMLSESGLDPQWHEVVSPKAGLLCFEQVTPMRYGHRPSDVLPDLAGEFRHNLWATVLSLPPYRKHYLYTSPALETPQRLPQLLSIYAVMYYLGSITRYRPQDFAKIVAGSFGVQIHTILSEQPTQFIYLMTSEFAKQEVTKAAIV